MPWGINVSYSEMTAGYEIKAISVSYFIIPQIEFETDIGVTNSKTAILTFSTKFHANKKYSKCGLTPFSGLTLGILHDDGIVKIPIGINYLSRFGLNASCSVGMIFSNSGYNDVFVEYKLGWHF